MITYLAVNLAIGTNIYAQKQSWTNLKFSSSFFLPSFSSEEIQSSLDIALKGDQKTVKYNCLLNTSGQIYIFKILTGRSGYLILVQVYYMSDISLQFRQMTALNFLRCTFALVCIYTPSPVKAQKRKKVRNWRE